MGLWDRIKGQFIEIIEWVDPSRETIVYKFPVYANEIKMGAKLTVRESQAAVFVNQGRIADVFPPGMYELQTQNMPILSTLMGWKYGFESPFKADIFFVNTRQFTDQKWGTQNPIIVRDPELGPVRLRAFGSYTFRVSDPGKLIRHVAGTDPLFQADEISGQLRNFTVSRFSDFVASAKIALYDLAQQYDELGDGGRKKINQDFSEYGIEITSFLVENVSVPPEVEAMIDKRGQMNIVGNLDQYQKFQTAQAIGDAAKNPSGGAGEGMGMGMGFAMAQQMVQGMNKGGAAPGPAVQMVICGCGGPNNPGSAFCSTCGKPLGASACPKCQAKLAAGAKFCSGCGAQTA